MSKFESKLVKALKFVSLNGAKNCKFEDKSVASLCNDVYLSHYVDEDIDISVDIAYLLKAIDIFGSSFSITQFVENLQIGDSEFKISCENKNSGIDWFPYGDIQRCDETESIIKGIKLLSSLIPKKKDEKIYVNGILFTDYQTMIATNRRCMLEFWHGENFPTGLLLLPAVSVIKRIKAHITSIKTTNDIVSSLAVFANDDFFLQAKIHPVTIPKRYLDVFSDVERKPFTFEQKQAINKILPFSGESIIVSLSNVSSISDSGHVQFDCEFEFEGEFYAQEMTYLNNAEYANVDSNGNLMFFNDELRGCISKFHSEDAYDSND